MKISLSIAVLILIAMGLISRSLQRDLEQANITLSKAIEQAEAAGVSTDPSKANRPRGEGRTLAETDMKSLAVSLAGFARELEVLSQEPDALEERHRKIVGWESRLSSLDPARGRELLDELKADTGINDETRNELIQIVLQALIEDHPQTVLDFIAADTDLLKFHGPRASTVSNALIRLMENDPAAATQWFKDHRQMFEGRTNDWITEKFLRGAGVVNPKAAFELINELNLADPEHAIRMITNPVSNPEERSAMLGAFREYLQSVTDPGLRKTLTFEGNSSLVSNALFAGFDSGLQWIESAGFSQEELEGYVTRSFRNAPVDERVKWLDWVSRNFTSEKVASQTVPQLFGEIVNGDYRAAGDWLEKAPEGPAKNAAAATYARALAPYQIETAIRWALTLPAGSDRDHTLGTIRGSWPKSDPAGAAAFAEKYGVK